MADTAKLRDDLLPCHSFEKAALHLRRPFTPEAVKWKAQAGTLVVPYVDARLVIERLNLVCPDWTASYRPEGKLMWCDLTVCGITRSDIGSGYEGKGLVSDALKRAAVQFGVGVSLYALKKVFLDADSDLIKKTGEKKNKNGKMVAIYAITDAGETWLREMYGKWLDKTGEQKFGSALDHGDVEGAIGDPEAEAPAEEAVEDDSPQPVDDEQAGVLRATALELYESLSANERKGLTKAAVNRTLAAATSHKELEKLIEELRERHA